MAKRSSRMRRRDFLKTLPVAVAGVAGFPTIVKAATLGRMSAYTGRAISWEWGMTSSKLNLMPAKLEFGPNPVDPVAVPGQTPLI